MNLITRFLLCAVASASLLGVSPAIEQKREMSLAEQQRMLVEAEWIADDIRFSTQKSEMTTAIDALGAVDGDTSENYGFHTASNETDAWWQVDLGEVYRLDRVVVYNRTDGGTARRTRNIHVLVSTDAPGDAATFKTVYEHQGSIFYGAKEKKPLIVAFDKTPVDARHCAAHGTRQLFFRSVGSGSLRCR